ncbi:undecaprenyl-diphosphate phosphatase [Weissella diestrammenae]|uniref:Undecaprenyl-diphosphatase n=1 Tax=Weissella diestrammenae TaxID=1162633 RepID=A0A7G9T7A8_9LACO|nr:undecaprenyl-diphosphate phosphatase [Weissella diestrammenae]MCM0581993.1 undecaprenyl-diphosphate phosphatase [Weissella diestrammenae]QNN75983.1 undecaprenyl-diphosphate phosphatase [Weissella diestrammenae]
MLEIIKSIIIGIVEGLTEFLPVSSTGHIIIAESLMNIPSGSVWTKAFTSMFDYVIQLGAIMAVIQLYFHKLNPFSPRKNEIERRQTWRLWSKVIVAVLPAAVIGLLLNDFMDAHFLNPAVVATALILYGILFIVLEKYNAREDVNPWLNDLNRMSYKLALAIGFIQVLSIVPGTSRSGATILGAMFLGVSRVAAAEFSFFLSIPVMFGVALLKVGSYLHKGGAFSGMQSVTLAIGFIVSWIVAWFAIKFMMNYIKNNDFKAFGWYRIIVGIIVAVLGVAGLLHM